MFSKIVFFIDLFEKFFATLGLHLNDLDFESAALQREWRLFNCTVETLYEQRCSRFPLNIIAVHLVSGSNGGNPDNYNCRFETRDVNGLDGFLFDSFSSIAGNKKIVTGYYALLWAWYVMVLMTSFVFVLVINFSTNFWTFCLGVTDMNKWQLNKKLKMR